MTLISANIGAILDALTIKYTKHWSIELKIFNKNERKKTKKKNKSKSKKE